jgi:hypothetical protein
MKDEILAFINDPGQLEKMYRSNKTLFKKEFALIYPQVTGNPIADTWNERLNFETDSINFGGIREVLIIISLALLAGFIAKIPSIFSLDEEVFLPKKYWFCNLSSSRWIFCLEE